MGLATKTLSEREKAALYYHVFGGLDDWRQLYRIADATTDGKDEVKFLDIYISKWKNSEKVKTFINELRTEQATRLAAERIKGGQEAKHTSEENETQPGESEHTETKKDRKQVEIIDYSDPKNRQRLYNEIIATAKDDPKTRLDAAKVFEQVQRDDREAAKAQKQSRVYLPLTCHDCPLYNKAKKKPTK